ncbi:MAG TPA: molybdopterin-binding protein, partial [Puia sp.]|nr:molybdopterin-binding protein [Puia sp.]
LCMASDGFKVVFSRDEIFSTMNSDNTYIVTESDGKKLKDINDRIAILMIQGPGKGHVYIKGLQKIIFRSVKE